jgi:catechol 2,3-dioxygenase-like lactoylglutathione lyase family enzyme
MTDTLFKQVLQIGIVVRDAEATARRYQELLGLDDWHFNEVDTARGKGADFRRGRRPIAGRALIAWMPMGEVELELIEPRDEDSVYAEFLRDRGPGVHHVMFATPDYDQCIEQLTARGVDRLSAGALQDTRFTLFDTQAELGLICEIADGGPLLPDRSGLDNG